MNGRKKIKGANGTIEYPAGSEEQEWADRQSFCCRNYYDLEESARKYADNIFYALWLGQAMIGFALISFMWTCGCVK